jgi:pyruvate/2-oxoacid:ferredoxin oxidoreductase alpha subunit
MANVNRALGAPWNIWNDQTDSLAQRDTGWLQFYCETNQECIDSVIQAYKIAENLSLPVMIVLDGFFLSHTEEPVDIPDQEKVDRFLPPREAVIKLDPKNPHVFNIIAPPESFTKMKRDGQRAMERAPFITAEADEEFRKIFGRGYDLVERIGSDNPDLVLITMGSVASTIREVIGELEREGKRIGLLRIRMFRPFPSDLIRGMLQGMRRVAVIDRGFAVGTGGVLSQEVKAALFGMDQPPLLYQFVTGLGGMDVTPEMVKEMINRCLRSEEGPKEVIWMGVNR